MVESLKGNSMLSSGCNWLLELSSGIWYVGAEGGGGERDGSPDGTAVCQEGQWGQKMSYHGDAQKSLMTLLNQQSM